MKVRLPARRRPVEVTGTTGTSSSRGATAAPRDARGPRFGLRRLVLVLGLLTVLAAAVLAVLLYLTSVFAVRTVTVEGVPEPLAGSVRQAAGIATGTPMARVDADAVTRRVLADRRIASLEVDRHWPSRLTLVAAARQPALVLQATDGTWYADEHGVVYQKVDAAAVPRKLSSVLVTSPAAKLSAATVQGLVDLWRERPDPDRLGGTLTRPVLRVDGSVRFAVDQVAISWGTPTQTTLKWRVVEQLLAQPSIDPQGPVRQSIDVSQPMAPVVDGIPPKPLG